MISPKKSALVARAFHASIAMLGAIVTAVLAFAPAQMRAQDSASAPLFTPPPFVSQAAAQTPAPGFAYALELDARRALETGLPTIAAGLYEGILANPALAANAPVRNRILVALATAYIEDDRMSDATHALAQFSGALTPAVQLRHAMIAARLRRFDAARLTASALTPEELSPEDRGWLFFLRGVLAEEAHESTAGALYQQAEATSVTPSQRAWFSLARTRTRLFLGEASEPAISSLRKTIDNYAGRPSGHFATSQLAVTYNMLGRRSEAIALLQTQLQLLALQEANYRNEWLLLLGLIAGPRESAGREALFSLLADSDDANKQRAALRLLVTSFLETANDNTLTNALDRFIAAAPPHPILPDLLLARAQLALAKPVNKNFLGAEKDASRLLAEFPGSELTAPALGVLTAIAWEQARYRAAATQATRARAELKTGETFAQLGVLVAEAHFRAKDFRNAADAYATALASVPEGVTPGTLMFQRVLAEIQAGSATPTAPGQPALLNAQKTLDSYAADPLFDAINRWQAEWNLARALQVAGDTAAAYARLNRLLDAAPENALVAFPSPPPAQNATAAEPLPADLRARMAWLQARLAFENGDAAQTLVLAQKLLPTLESLEATLRDDLTSTTLLLEAQAALALNEPEQTAAATETLRTLRTRYSKTAAAVTSYLIEADTAANRGQLVEAQGLLQKLADDYHDTTYAPYALYRAALYAERRGQDKYYREAYTILENLVGLLKNSPENELVLQARLKQGNLLRLLNDYGAARNLYEDLLTRFKYPQYPEALMAELALADCDAALATTEASRAESAAARYERLLDQQSAPLDLRVEAGYKFGLSLAATPARLEAVWWPMINSFLLDDAKAATLGARGRYWMSRTLLKLAESLEQQSKFSQARELHELLIRKNLPGSALAQEHLARPSNTALGGGK